MKNLSHYLPKRRTAICSASLLLFSVVTTAATEPDQTPLLTSTSGATPNLIITLDNSGSMNTNDADYGGSTVKRHQAIGRILKDVLNSGEYDGKFRLGIGLINGVTRPGVYVRKRYSNGTYYADQSDSLWSYPKLFSGDHKTDTIDFLDDRYISGNVVLWGTPLHNSVKLAGDFYSRSLAYENKNGKELSCRKNYNILFTDGYWNGSELSFPGNKTNYDSQNGPEFTNDTDGSKFRYRPYQKRANQTQGNYIPYPDPYRVVDKVTYVYSDAFEKCVKDDQQQYGQYYTLEESREYCSKKHPPTKTVKSERLPSNYYKGLSDITAYYFWHKDLRPNLDNKIKVEKNSGDPTFWQNMKTFTIGYKLTPDTPTLFDNIKTYESKFEAGTTRGRRSPFGGPSKNSNSSCYGSGGCNWFDFVNLSNGSNSSNAINDVIHAGYAGGGKGYSVSSSEEVKNTFKDIFSQLPSAVGNDAGVSVSGGPSVSSLQDEVKYTVNYSVSENSGDITAYKLKEDGSDASTTVPPTPEWKASERLPNMSDRKIYTRAGTGVKTIISSTNLTASNYGAANYAAIKASGLFKLNDASLSRYLLGSATEKSASGLKLRAFETKIGAIVNSPPLLMSNNLNMAYTGSDSTIQGKDEYTAYLERKANAYPTLYAATNSGLIHVFNAATATGTNGNTALTVGGSSVKAGTELAAYLPSSVMGRLHLVADITKDFTLTTDGPMVEADIYNDSRWKHMVYGTGGRGGKFIYALQAPLSSSSLSRVPTGDHFKWEVNADSDDHANIAYITNKANTGQLQNGDWVVISNSGHYPSASQQRGLYVLDAATGAKKHFIALPASYQNGRGLSGVTLVRDKTRRIVAAYAGDTNGNLWRFDLRAGKMKVSYNKPLFTGSTTQPIYASPAWQVHPGGLLPDGTTKCKNGDKTETAGKCGTIIGLGTGILLEKTDGSNTAKQALYGVWDPTPIGGDDVSGFTTLVASSADMVEQTIGTVSEENPNGYLSSKNKVDYKAGKRGWKMSLDTLSGVETTGERVIASPINLGVSFFFSSVIVSPEEQLESCEVDTKSPPNVIYGLDALSGGFKSSFGSPGGTRTTGFSILYVPDGGFARGNAFKQLFETGDSVNSKIRTGDGEGCTGDSCCPNGEPKCEPKCVKGVLINRFGVPIKSCKEGGDSWQRSWRQILRVPQ